MDSESIYFEEFCDLYCDGSVEEYIIATIMDLGYGDTLFYRPSDPKYVSDLIQNGLSTANFHYHHWSELYNEIWNNISSHVGNALFLKRYICSLIMPFRELSRYFFPGPDSDERTQFAARFLLAINDFHLPIDEENEIIAKGYSERMRNSEEFKSLSPEEQEKFCALSTEELLRYKSYFYNTNIYEITRLVSTMMQELAVIISAFLLESGEKSTLFDYQRMCGVVLTDALYPYYFCRTMDWTLELAESYLPSPIFYYEGGGSALSSPEHTVEYIEILPATMDALDPLSISKWRSLSELTIQQYSAYQYLTYGGNAPIVDWEKMKGENYDRFSRDVSTVIGDTNKVRQACLVIIQRVLYWFLELRKDDYVFKLHGEAQEFYIQDNLLLGKYIARIIGKTLPLDPSLCFFRLAEELGFKFDNFFKTMVDYTSAYNLLFDPRLFLRLRADQCLKCNKQLCAFRIDDPANFVFGGKGELMRISPTSSSGSSCPTFKEKGVNIIVSDKNSVKSKIAITSERLHTGKANALYSKLEKDKYIRAGKDGKYVWLKNLDLFAYFCYKLTDTFVGRCIQIEVKYITQAIIGYDGNLETVSSYARRYRTRNKPRRPSLADYIDNTIEEAYKGYYGI